MKSFVSCLLAIACTLAVFTGCGERGARSGPGTPDESLADAEGHTRDLTHLQHPPADPRAALEAAIRDGAFDGMADPARALARLLETCAVPAASQVLVFSKTSMQDDLIHPHNPRAVYFSDDFYVGYVPGGVIEISDTDPERGTGFFIFDPGRPSLPLASPVSCLNCHESSRTHYAPGLLVRSVFPDDAGFPIGSAGSFVTTHASPLEQRWGGWYVTGLHGRMRHMGNAIARDLGQDAVLDREPGANRTTLDGLVNTGGYLAPGSDIVALMVLEHQVPMHNLLTQGAMSVREQAERSRRVGELDGRSFDPYASDTLMSLVDSVSERIVRHMLFVDELVLTDRVSGDRAFVRQFRANRRESADGRSLKDLDLTTRLFRYRCSYMVYSRAFEMMPPLLTEAVYQKLFDALTGPETGLNAHLPAKERAAILAILRETKDGLPGYWFELD